MENAEKKMFLRSYRSLQLTITTIVELIELLTYEQNRYTLILGSSMQTDRCKTEIESLTLSLKDLLNEKNMICDSILHQISQMDSEIEKNILILKYLLGYTWEQISEITNYSLRQVYNIHNQALCHMDVNIHLPNL